MKKTLTINLNGIVFNIDEDAYNMLNTYLTEISKHFDSTDRDEILRDIEARIAELFTERLQNRNVVENADVEFIIEKLGQPNQYGDETETESTQSAPERKKSRKFYRDSDNRLIAGVAGGFATYIGWDTTLVRVLFLLLLLASVGWMTLLYVLLWIIVPEAKTVAQKLEMQGIEPNVDNIKNYVPKESKNDENRNRALEVIGTILRVCFIIVGGGIGIALFCGVLGLIISIFALLSIGYTSVAHLGLLVGLLICIILFLLCPGIGLLMLCIRLVSRKSYSHRWFTWALLIVWFVSFLGIIGFGVRLRAAEDLYSIPSIASQLPQSIVRHTQKALDTAFDESNAISEQRSVSPFTQIEANDAIRVIFTQSNETSVVIKAADYALRDIETRVENGKLIIENNAQNTVVQVEISAPNINKIEIEEASRFSCANELNLKQLTIEVSEASCAELKGKIGTLYIEASEASLIDVTAAKIDEISAIAKEASNIALNAVKDANLKAHNGSSITYKHIEGKQTFNHDTSSRISKN